METVALLISAICFVESSNVHTAINIQDGGSPSYGKCQIKKSTAQHLGYRGSISRLWLDPVTNQYWAEQYLRSQLRRYNGDIHKAVSAYNAGSVRNGKIINPKYVQKVMNHYERLLRERQNSR